MTFMGVKGSCDSSPTKEIWTKVQQAVSVKYVLTSKLSSDANHESI